MTDTIEVKIAMVPGLVKNVAVPVGATVKQVLEIADMSAGDGFAIRMNDTDANLDDPVANVPGVETRIIISQKVKGNTDTVEVKIAMVPGLVKNVAVPVGATVEQVLEIADMSAGDGFAIRMNDADANLDDPVANVPGVETRIIISQKVKGNTDTVEVKIAMVPGLVKNVAVPVGATVKQVLEIADMSVGDGFAIRMNDADANLDDPVANVPGVETRIIISQKVKGNF